MKDDSSNKTSSCNKKRALITTAIIAILFIIVLTISLISTNAKKRKDAAAKEATAGRGASPKELRVAFLGNSILYYNDCPRVIEEMLKTNNFTVVQDSCLNGAETIPSLFAKGSNMDETFGDSENAKEPDGSLDIGAQTVQDLLSAQDWDFVILNDYTQGPARMDSRNETIKSLQEEYGPLFTRYMVPIFLQTPAYRNQVEGSKDLGSVANFTDLLKEGYDAYAQAFANFTIAEPRIGPVGDAFLYVHNSNLTLWEELFYSDDVHPSPSGTWLEACVLYCTMLNEAPPAFERQFFDTVRYFPSGGDDLPSVKQAAQLRDAAIEICGI